MTESTEIDRESRLPWDERFLYPRYLGFRPADGQVCNLSPPRFSWPCDPEVIPPGPIPAGRKFRLHIGTEPGLGDPFVETPETPYNFYNALPVLSGARRWYWQVTYDPETPHEQKSRVRSFELTPDAVDWDRTVVANLGPRLSGHPRIIFTPENTAGLLSLRQKDAECAEIARQAIQLADETLGSDWFRDFPPSDTDEAICPFVFAQYAQYLHNLAFAFMLTGDEKYLAAKERLVALASYPPGGKASPEGVGAANKFSTKITEHLGVAFDWLYDALSEAERDAIIHSLDWRIGHIMNSYSWLHEGCVRPNGIAISPGSHPWENITWTLTGALAVAEHSEAARQFAKLGLNYLAGVANGYGPDEGWNEGVSYSNWKFSSLVATTMYAAMTLPELHLERNRFFHRMGEFFLHLCPLGGMRPGWGDMAYQYRYYERGQLAYFRKLAYLTGNASLLAAWHEWRDALDSRQVRPLKLGDPEIYEITSYPRPWVEYALRHFFPEPRSGSTPRSRIYPVAGWAMSYSEPPGTLKSFRDGVGFVLNCRPRGGYSHSHRSNGSFELYAYGKAIATGGGSKSNSDKVARSSQSYNTVLIDGRGQSEVSGSPEHPNAGRLVAWKETPELTYVCADVRNAYVEHPQLERFFRHFLFVRNRYFVVFDDLSLRQGSEPAVFSWLYHIQPDASIGIGPDSFDYAIEGTRVKVQHLGGTAPIEILNMTGDDWYCNPVTAEDRFEEARALVTRRPELKEIWDGCPRVHNNLWVSTEPRTEARFLAAILPWREDEREPQAHELAPGVIEVIHGQSPDAIAFGRTWDGALVVVDCDSLTPD